MPKTENDYKIHRKSIQNPPKTGAGTHQKTHTKNNVKQKSKMTQKVTKMEAKRAQEAINRPKKNDIADGGRR